MSETHHFIITMQNPASGTLGTLNGTLALSPGALDSDAYRLVVDRAREQGLAGVVLFYRLVPLEVQP